MVGLGLYSATLLLSLFSAATAKPEYVDYYNYAPSLATREADGYAKISVPNEDGLGWYVNTPVKAKYCGVESSVRCVKLGGLVLAAPIGKMSVGTSWTLEDREFRVTSIGEVSLLGKAIPFFAVESSKKDDLYRYLFNENLGVIALIWPSRVRDEPGEIYFLGTSKGVLSPIDRRGRGN